ncbi:iron complex outermembrane receptor protein [Hephaestia caeni]|uniref:Iron complex outermembrane receptor protein n=1 Tax=Hephaestia caeni TaxID=645617 RepID=A0A397PE41_9SPHN|nr:TonB-dependent receptor [Hephaestia caeni]RIA45485.1 iron complex outermembrane receptor protein [Hephaestia caeni]
MGHKPIVIATACIGISLCGTSPAWAQEAATAEPAAQAGTRVADATANDRAPIDTGDIIVTAQRRSERLVDVPISIAAIDGAQSRNLGAESSRDISQLVPGVVIPSQGVAVQPAIRGITSQGSSAGDEPNVATYIDDFYLASAYESTIDLADVERIEVLKGPQGTLFGRNATGGAIKIITRTPQFTPEANFTASYGFDFKEIKLGGFVTGPVSDSIAASLAVNHSSNEGYVYNLQSRHNVASRDTVSVRGRLLIDITPRLRTIITGNFAKGNDNAVFALVPIDGNNTNYANPTLVKPNNPKEMAGVDPVLFFHVYGAQANTTLDLDAIEIRSITGYRDSNAKDAFDTDRTILKNTSSFSNISTEQFSQELTASTTGDGVVSGTAGVYYSDTDATYISTGFNGDLRFDPGSMSMPVGTIRTSLYSNVVTTSLAGFGEVTFKVTDALKLVGGLRYTSEKKVFNLRDIVRAAGLRQIVDEGKRWNSLTYRAIAQYQFNPDFNIYASVNTGFKSGVFASLTFPTNVVDPEKITAYEIGTKAKLGSFNLSAAAFYYDYRDIQVQASDLVNGVKIIANFNAAKANVKGLDFSASGPILPGLNINLGVGWLPTAKYTSFPGSQVSIPLASGFGNLVVSPYDSSGSRMIRAPRLTANFGATAKHDFAGGTLLASGNVAYNSGYYFQPANLGFQKSYTIVNASLGWRTADEVLTASVFAENMFDARYAVYRAFGTIGTSQAYNRPRLIGIRLQTAFK